MELGGETNLLLLRMSMSLIGHNWEKNWAAQKLIPLTALM